jgi:hypothetical protein
MKNLIKKYIYVIIIPVFLLGILFNPVINQQSSSIHKIIEYQVNAYSWSRKTRGYVEIKNARVTEMKFNENDQLISSSVYTKGRKLYEKNNFTYVNGKRTEKRSYDSKNKLNMISRYKYTGSGLQESVSDEKETLVWSYLYISNPDGTTKEKRTYDQSRNLIQKCNYYYDESSRLKAKIISLSDGSPIHISEFSYEKSDSHGNWTRRKEVQSYGDVYKYPKEVINRTTTYLKGRADTGQKKNRKGRQASFQKPKLTVNSLFKLNSIRARERNSGGKVLANALKKIRAKTIIKGSCYDWINMVYNENGYKGKKREKIFWSKESGPYANASKLKPGDWIMFKNLTYGEIGHSGIFLSWLDFDKKSAMVIGYAGQKRTMPGRYREYEITRLFGVLRGKD